MKLDEMHKKSWIKLYKSYIVFMMFQKKDYNSCKKTTTYAKIEISGKKYDIFLSKQGTGSCALEKEDKL